MDALPVNEPARGRNAHSSLSEGSSQPSAEDAIEFKSRMSEIKDQTKSRFSEKENSLEEPTTLTEDTIAVPGETKQLAVDCSTNIDGMVMGGMAGLLGQGVQGLLARQPMSQDSLDPISKPAVQLPQVAVIQNRCEELVERILVSQQTVGESSEIRITVDRSWLPETEIMLSRNISGGLDVEFMSDEVDSQRFLTPNLSSLRERLEERLGTPVMVRMTESSDANTGDGRSRARRSIYDELKDNE